MKRKAKGMKIDFELDDVAKVLSEFSKNVEYSGKIREQFQGNYVAICDQRVVGFDTEYNSLWNKIAAYLSEKQLYVSYIPEETEALVV
jgi:hypothetical protein